MKITFWRAGAVFLLFCFYGTYLVFLQAAPQVALLGASEWADFPNGAGVKTNRFHTLRVLNFPDGIWQCRLRHWMKSFGSQPTAFKVGNNGSNDEALLLKKAFFLRFGFSGFSEVSRRGLI